MATNTGIKFYSKAFEAGAASTLSTETTGSIVFDKTSKAIYVNGVKYGGSLVADATYSSNILTITKTDNTSITLDFSTLANAASVMKAFDDVAAELNAIETGAGLNADGTYTANGSANYIADATSLKDADNKLDTAVKNISDSLLDVTDFKYYINGTTPTTTTIRTITENNELKPVIDVTDAVAVANPLTTKTYVDNKVAALDGSATIASKSGDVVTLKAGLTEVDGVVSNNSGTDIVLEEVATTGAAADVSIADANSKFTATTVEGALEELKDAITSTTVSVASNEKIISKSNSNELSSTLTIAIEKQGESGNQKDYIVLKGINDTEVAKVDASAFVLDGMLDSAELVTTAESGVSIQVPYIKLTFNTASQKQPVRFSVSSLVDTYTSGNTTALTVSGYQITPNTSAVAENAGTLTTGGQVYTAIQNATNQIQTITGETATTQGDYINVKVSAAKGTNDNNYTLSTTSNVTTHAVSTAASGADGLATALDVKTYVDTKAAVVNSSATVPVNSTTATTLATVGGTAITAKASFTWEEYE